MILLDAKKWVLSDMKGDRDETTIFDQNVEHDLRKTETYQNCKIPSKFFQYMVSIFYR